MILDPKRTKKFSEGCMWDNGWELQYNIECGVAYSGTRCKHCSEIETKIKECYDGSLREELVWYCPRVAVAFNEGGYNSTGICADCIKEALEQER